MICKLCKQDKKLIRAHLMPDSLVSRVVDKTKEGLKSIDLRDGTTKIRQTLEADKEILCGKCDSYLGLYDEKLVQLIDRWSAAPIRRIAPDKDSPARAEKIDCNTTDLLLSLAAILLRFSFSTRHEWMSLGKYEEIFSAWIKARELPQNFERYFSAIALGYAIEPACSKDSTDIIDLSKFLRQIPRGGRSGQAHQYFLELPSIFFIVKVGQGQWNFESQTNYPTIPANAQNLAIPNLPFSLTKTFREDMAKAVSLSERWIQRQHLNRQARHTK